MADFIILSICKSLGGSSFKVFSFWNTLSFEYSKSVFSGTTDFINHSYYDATVIISKTPPKVNGRYETVNLETLKRGVESLGKEEIEIDCVQRTIFNVAQQYVGKKLV
jgi:hypothetical protein